MKRLFVWICVLVILGIGSPARADAAGKNQVQSVDGSWSESRSAMTGESVLCRAELTMPASGEGVYTGRLSRGLSFIAVTAVERGEERLNAAYYTVLTARQGEAAFTIHISPLAVSPGERMTVEYILMLNDGAEEENHFSLASDGAEASKGCIRCFTLTGLRAVILPETGQPKPLSGACLCLSYDPAGRDRVAFRMKSEDRYMACSAEECSHSRHLYVIKTPLSGRVYLEGLSAGTYYLCETRPADGMGERAKSVELLLTPEGELWTDGVRCPDRTAMLTNSAGPERQEEHVFSLTEFYRRGSEALSVALLALIAARRYYL
ncbi:MAG: hypothetical protein IKQ69_03890 [Oscillospiraceae bacterium]|nr:hypothetical protein [Oscillospiraceae bacterium]